MDDSYYYVSLAFETFKKSFKFELTTQNLITITSNNYEFDEVEKAIYEIDPDKVDEWYQDDSRSWYFAYLSSYGKLFFLKGVLASFLDNMPQRINRCIEYLKILVYSVNLDSNQVTSLLVFLEIIKSLQIINSSKRAIIDSLIFELKR